MAGLTLSNNQKIDFTIIPNNFIDNYIGNANGEFVKVYLYLLRCSENPPHNFSLFTIADRMNLTESDVLRALKYWEQQGLVKIRYSSQNVIQSIVLCETGTLTSSSSQQHLEQVSPLPSTLNQVALTSAPTLKDTSSEKKTPSSKDMDICRELGLIAEQYLKKTLTSDELDKIMYFYDTLHFSADLIEYLFEHCVTIGNKHFRYIETVATAWADQGITTVKQAKEEGQQYRREYFAILKSFGIQNRAPIDMEVEYMKRWMDEYHFTTDIIHEACQRTISKTGKPTFAYADTILKNWKEQGILAKRDIVKSDNAHYAMQNNQITEKEKTTRQQPRPAARFNNFEQREEYNFNELEKQLNCT